VVRAIVDLAKGFGCETGAGDVEDGDVSEQLRDYGVDYAQGFHLGRPVPL
jgi:EAL domain-containing protein (putative c-di-GMP-specific phosphodiesterase class I)